MKQLHGFDELRNDQGMIQNRCAKTDTTVVSLYWSTTIFAFSISSTSQNNRENGDRQKSSFLVVQMEDRINTFPKRIYGLQLHVETIHI
jgi:hypothetical protein